MGEKVLVILDREQLDWLDDWRFDQRFKSRSEAIRWLLDRAKQDGLSRNRSARP